MVKFSYLPTGEIVRVIDTFNSLNEPTKPIPPEATKLHGITDGMVAGQQIDDKAVELFASDAVVSSHITRVLIDGLLRGIGRRLSTSSGHVR